MNDTELVEHIADQLGALPHVEAVALGGSRATGSAREDSDWDFAVYYRGDFDPQSLRDVGWTGSVSELGGWGGGVFNGGAWLTVANRRVDVHFRDLAAVERELAASEAGVFQIEPLMFHLAGIPTYILAAELAINVTVRGRLPRPHYSAALRVSAASDWSQRGRAAMEYARDNHARRGEAALCLGQAAVSAVSYAHAILAARGEWVTNDKGILRKAGIDEIDLLVAGVSADPPALLAYVEAAWRICRTGVAATAR